MISVVCQEDGEATLRILQLESSTCRIMHTSDPLKGTIHNIILTTKMHITVDLVQLLHAGCTTEVTGHTFLSNGR